MFSAENPRQRESRLSPGVVAVLVLLILLSAALGWSAKTLLQPPSEETHSASYALVTVEEGTLGRNLELSAQAAWREESVLIGKSQGTLTSIPAGREARINAGDVLYTVDLQPVFVFPGEIPTFRAMDRQSEGADVAQLQKFLFDTYGWDLVPDGKFGESTEKLVKKWQKDHGLEPSGHIPAGQILFVPHLPITVSWAEDIKVGSELQEGTQLLKIFGQQPAFTMSLPEGQLRAAHEGQTVVLDFQGHTWEAHIGTIRENDEDKTLTAELVPLPGEESICAEQCTLIGPQGIKGINATLVVIPEKTGQQVPVASIRVDATGQTVVVSEDGKQIPVTVLATVGGQSIVDGIDSGQRIRVWGMEVDSRQSR